MTDGAEGLRPGPTAPAAAARHPAAEAVDLAALARYVQLDVEADLRIDAPFGPLHLRSEDRALVIGVGGWWSALRMALWARRSRTVPARSLLAALATATGQPVRLQIPLLPRLTLARP